MKEANFSSKMFGYPFLTNWLKMAWLKKNLTSRKQLFIYYITISSNLRKVVILNLEIAINLFLGDESLICSNLKIPLKAIRQCELCHKEFHGSNSSRDYKRHLHKHEKEPQRRFCRFCNKYFEVKFNYQRHSKSRKCLNNQDNYYKNHRNSN